jgi:hypothetical protein
MGRPPSATGDVAATTGAAAASLAYVTEREERGIRVPAAAVAAAAAGAPVRLGADLLRGVLGCASFGRGGSGSM